MTDQELLELAAKAAGLDDGVYESGTSILAEAIWSQKLFDEVGSGYWNPLTSDGDAFRMAVNLDIRVKTRGCGPGNYHGSWGILAAPRRSGWSSWGDRLESTGIEVVEEYRRDGEQPCDEFDRRPTDKAAAARRAIVRAAAQLGRLQGVHA